jgi:starch synthase
MYCIHIASELAPLAKVGGLADVILGLCREISWKGYDVDIIIPKYDCMDASQIRDLSIDCPDVPSFYNGEWHHNTVWTGWVENLKIYFIESRHPRFFFNRGCFYGCEDDLERYLYFSRAALEFLFKKQLRPDIIHLHEWQTAAIAPLYYDMYYHMGYNYSKIVFTMHNLDYQGKCATGDLDRIGLRGSEYLTQDKLEDGVSPGLINLLKGGIVYSDYVTTVSPNYAKEILTPEGGRGLDTTLLKYKDKFAGILNGIDYSFWNPEIDRYLPINFSSRELPKDKKDRLTINNKSFVKKILREKMMLEESHKPIVGCITRLVPQKGIELIKLALKFTLERQGQFVLLGSTSIPSINSDFFALKQEYSANPNVHFILHHQEDLAHLIYAASDIFIVPSLVEPCGLTQMISLKYGTIPVVHKTGGLADTIFDFDFSDKPEEKRNGYTFDNADEEGLKDALGRAIHDWFEHPDKWRQYMVRGMNIDFSWNIPSNYYLDIYRKISQKGLKSNSLGQHTEGGGF